MSDADNKRQDLEQQALKRFQEVAKRYTTNLNDGQGKGNQLANLGKSSFQFGDLRVNTQARHIVIEVESAGGVTNLVKYWYCLDQGLIVKPVTLLHIFRQTSANDYLSHLLLWDALSAKMSTALGSRFTAKRYMYRDPTELESIVDDFEQLLLAEFGLKQGDDHS